MANQIEWTTRAQKTFEKTVEYLHTEFGEKSAEKFIQKVDDFAIHVKQNSQLGKIEVEDKTIRSWRDSKFSYAFYRIKNNKIVILKFCDGRQNPKERLK